MLIADPYTLEDAERDIGTLRGQADRLSEVLTKNDSTDVPNTPAAGLIHYSLAGQHKYASSDGSSYGTGRLILVNTSNVTLNNTGMTSIFPNFSAQAVAYLLRSDLLISLGGTACAVTMQVTGPAIGAAANVKWQVTYESGTGESVFAGHSIGNLNSATFPAATFPASSVVHVKMCAYVPFTATGTVNVQSQISVASATTQASLGGTFEILPI